MIRQFEIVKGQREYLCALTKDTDYCVSGSGTFTLEVLWHGKVVYGVILRENYIQLPKFPDDVQLRMIGRDTMAFTIYVNDSRLS